MKQNPGFALGYNALGVPSPPASSSAHSCAFADDRRR
jgi:hypothetical protein